MGGDERLVAPEGRRPRFSPDGSRIAYWTGSEHLPVGCDVWMVHVAGGEAELIKQGRSPVWSADGEYLLLQSGEWKSDWLIVSVNSGEQFRTGAIEVLLQQDLLPETGRMGQLFIPDSWGTEKGSVVFAARTGDATNLWELSISPKAWKIEGPAERLTSGTGIETQASLAEGHRLVFTSLINNMDVWSLPIDPNKGIPTGEMRRLTTNAAADTHPSISVDGRKIVFRSNRSGNWDIYIRDLEIGKETALTVTPLEENWPIITNDGNRVAYTLIEDPIWSVYSVSSSGGIPQKVFDRESYIRTSDWSSQEEILCKGGGTPLLNILTSELTYLADIKTDPRFSSDNQWIAFHRGERALRRQLFITPFRDRAVGGESEWIAVTDGLGNDQRAAWSPDGNLLYFLSDRDGFRCIWAQPLNPTTKQPIGSPFAVHHLHDPQRSLVNVTSGPIGLSVAQDKIVFAMPEVSGNIWMMEPQSTK